MEENYVDKVNEKIEYAKLLNSIRPECIQEAGVLLQKKKEIMQKNGFFADLQLKKINRKLEKLKK